MKAAAPRARVALTLLAAVWWIAGCLPSSIRPSASAGATEPPRATASPHADLCGQLSAAIAERAALGHVLNAMIAGNVEEAMREAHSLRDRLAALIDALPDERGLGEPQARVRDLALGVAEALAIPAATFDDPRVRVADRDAILHEGMVLLAAFDVTSQMPEPGDRISELCPGLVYTADPVTFPPPPSNEALGLPVTVGNLLLEPHVWRIDTTMAELIEPLGVDPDPVRMIDVWVSPGGGSMDVYDRVAAPPAALAQAIGDLMATGAKRAAPREIAGFTVFTYRYENAAGPSLHVAARGDRLIVFHSLRSAAVRDILQSMP